MPCFKVAPQQQESKAAPAASASPEELLKLAVDDLIKRKDKKPRTPKALRSTIHARCGITLPATKIDAVLDALVKRGYVKINGEEVTYALPAPSS